MTEIELQVLSSMERLTATEQRVAEYFLRDPKSIFRLPIAQLAKECNVSQVIWVRFAKDIGFHGLKELKKTLFTQLNNSAGYKTENAAFSDIKEHSSVQGIANALMNSSIQTIQNTVGLLNCAQILEVARLLIDAPSIRLFGIGASGMVAQDFFYKLQRINKHAFFFSDSHIQLTAAANLLPEEIAFFISNTGATTEILEMMDLAKAAGCITVSLTRYGLNPLSQKADHPLFVAANEIHMRSGAMTSRLAQLLVIDILFTTIANLDYAHIENALEKSYSACATHKAL